MGISIGQGLLAGSEGIAQGFIEGRKNKRKSSQAILDASQQEFDNDIATKRLKVSQGELTLRQDQFKQEKIEEADILEKQELGKDANRRLFTGITGASTTETTGFKNNILGDVDKEVGKVDIKSNLLAFSQIPEESHTKATRSLLESFQKADKLGASTIGADTDLLSSVGSEEDRSSLFNALDSIPIENQTNLTASIGGRLSDQEEDLSGIIEETRPLTVEERRANMNEMISQEPDFFLQSEQDQDRFFDRMEKTLVADEEAETRAFNKKKGIFDLKKIETQVAKDIVSTQKMVREMNTTDEGFIDYPIKDMVNDYYGKNTLKDFDKVSTAYEKVVASGDPKNHTPASDMALVFAFMRILDPSSVVRESEYRTAEEAQAQWKLENDGDTMPAKFVSMLEKVINGKRLLRSTREDFINQANKMYWAQAKSASVIIDQYTQLATDAGHKLSNVVPQRHRDIAQESAKRTRESNDLLAKQNQSYIQSQSGHNVSIQVNP